MFTVTPLASALGAELHGVDLTRKISVETLREIRRLLVVSGAAGPVAIDRFFLSSTSTVRNARYSKRAALLWWAVNLMIRSSMQPSPHSRTTLVPAAGKMRQASSSSMRRGCLSRPRRGVRGAAGFLTHLAIVTICPDSLRAGDDGKCCLVSPLQKRKPRARRGFL